MMRNTKSHDSPPADVSSGTPGCMPGTLQKSQFIYKYLLLSLTYQDKSYCAFMKSIQCQQHITPALWELILTGLPFPQTSPLCSYSRVSYGL